IPSLEAVDAPQLVPLWMDRFFKMRPRGPVQNSSPEGSESTGSAQSEPFVSPATLPVYPSDAAGDFFPLFIDRGFRMRPRGAVPSVDLPLLETIASQNLDTSESVSAKPTLPVSVIGEYAPLFVDRGFRARPRGPVQAAG